MDFDDLVGRLVDPDVQEHLGGPVTYSPGTGDPVAVRGVFFESYVLVDKGNAGVSSSGPAVFLTLADLPSDPETDDDFTVTVDGVEYKERETKPDGLGGVMILLNLA